MLSPERTAEYADAETAFFDEITNAVLVDMVRRIKTALRVTDTAKWDAARAKALGASAQFMVQQLNQISGITPQVAAMFAQAMLESDANEQRDYAAAGQAYTPLGSSTAAQQLVNSGYRRTMNTLYNLTQTRALMGNDNLPATAQAQLARQLDLGHQKITSGVFDYDGAIRAAINSLAQEGLQAITYPSGHTDTLEVVVRRAMLTGINQTAGDISLHNAQTLGVDIMELSAHAGARVGDGNDNFTNHSWWQGKLVSLSGQPGYLTLDDIGYGDVRGFQGANCRHNWHPFWPGISVRNYTQKRLDELNSQTVRYKDQDVPLWKANEMQRAKERKIRRCKRAYLLARESTNPSDKTAAAAKLKAARDDLKDFLKQTGLKSFQLQETVAGFSRSEASSASWAARQQAIT